VIADVRRVPGIGGVEGVICRQDCSVISDVSHRAADLRLLLRFLLSRLAFALTVRSPGFKAAATIAVAACGVVCPVRTLDAIRIVSVCTATAPDVAAATFSDTIRFNSARSLDVIPAATRIGHRHHSVMLVSRPAARRSAAK
jgi:hypothetical protein